MNRRLAVLGAVLAALALLAAAVLAEVLATVFFSITVAYLLLPVRRRLTDRGLSPWAASAVTTAGAFFGSLALLVPLVAVVALRADELVALLRTAPDHVTLELFGYVYTLTVEEVLAALIALARDLAGSIPSVVPVLLIKLSLFALLLFSLLFDEFSIRRAALAVTPPAYRDAVSALERRARETLFAIYVLQAATAAATFLVALPVFFAFGYRYFVALATVAAVLQFLPVVGPSVLVTGVALYRVAVGDVAGGAALFVVGNVVVSWLPDVAVRPRLAEETANLPGSLYFVGFVGGLLTLGTVGIIAGPLIVALVVEAAGLLSAELEGAELDGVEADDGRDDTEPGAPLDAGGDFPLGGYLSTDPAPSADAPATDDGSPPPGTASKEP